MESGTNLSKVDKKCVIHRNRIPSWVLPGNKEKIEGAFKSSGLA